MSHETSSDRIPMTIYAQEGAEGLPEGVLVMESAKRAYSTASKAAETPLEAKPAASQDMPIQA